MRIRTIKPEFWRSRSVAELPREIRLLWVGLWSYVDDNGVGVDDHRQIAADLFPLEDDPIEAREFVREGLATLSRALRITRYASGGRSLLYVNGWDEHQRVDKPNKSRYPLPGDNDDPATSEDPSTRDTVATPSRESRENLAPVTGEQGNRGTGEQGEIPRSTRATENTSKRRGKSTPNGFDEFWSAYPKRVGKQAAVKAWRKATELAEPDVITEGARRYAESRSGEDPKFTAHPSTWLNAGRWDDEPQPAYTPPQPIPTKDARIARLQALKAHFPDEPHAEPDRNVRALPRGVA